MQNSSFYNMGQKSENDQKWSYVSFAISHRYDYSEKFIMPHRNIYIMPCKFLQQNHILWHTSPLASYNLYSAYDDMITHRFLHLTNDVVRSFYIST